MSRYINADSLIEHAEVNGEDKAFIRKLLDYMDDNENEDVDVVFCHECIHMKESGGHANCWGYLKCRLTGKSVDPEDFCSKGEDA